MTNQLNTTIMLERDFNKLMFSAPDVKFKVAKISHKLKF